MDTIYNVTELRIRSEAIENYINERSLGRDKFLRRKTEYRLDPRVVQDLKKHTKGNIIFVFSAEWCPDCHRNVPVLDLIRESTGMEIRVFGHIMKNTKDSTKKWAVPPSPKEVEEFGVTKIPYIIVMKENGQKLGEIIENPPQGKTLEASILEILMR